MYNDIDERVPQGGASLFTVFALPGLVLGLVGWLVSRTIEGDGPHALPEAGLMALVIGGLGYGLIVFTGQVARAAVSALGLALATGILYFVAQGGQGAEMSNRVIPVAANFAILTVALPFLRAASRDHRLTDYAPLYGDAWNIPAIVGIATLFQFGGLLLALLVGALFEFIGLGFIRKMMGEPWFLWPYSAMLFGVGLGVIRQRETAVLAARGIKMALLRVTAPVFAACVTVFVVAVMLRGFGSLIGELSPVATLTAAGIVTIIMINAIVGEAGRPEGVLFGATGRLLAVLLLFLMALAVYGLFLRVTGEGWTPNRIAGTVVILVTALYAPLYAVAGLTEQWAILRQGNIAISALLVLIAGFIQTPLFRPYDWSVRSQLALMEAAPDAVTDADLAYLRDRLGEPGSAAFDEIAASGGALATRAEKLPRVVTSTTPRIGNAVDDALASGALRIHPEGTPLPPEVRSRVGNGLMVSASTVVVVDERGYWQVRLLEDTRGRLLVDLIADPEGASRYATQYVTVDDPAAVLDALAQSGITYERRVFSLPVIGGTPFYPDSRDLENFEVSPVVPSRPVTPTDPLGEEPEAGQ